MAKKSCRNTIFSFFACFWLTAALVSVYGAGGRDADLTRADQLISNKEYDQAILLLTEHARRNPDQFDQAQARLNKIYQIREEFNKTADILIETLLDDPGNDEKILALTTKLRSLENENSPVLVNFLSRIHDIALFNVSRNQLRMALENGRSNLDKEDFDAAFQSYAAGMSIMRDEFYSANYSAAVHNQTRQETERLNTVIAGFRQVNSQLESAAAELTRAVTAGQHARIPEIMTRLVPAMDRFIAQKQQVFTSVAVLERNLADLQRANPGMGDRNHIAFIIRVIYGRTDQDIQEGILGVFDNTWKKSVGSSLNAIIQTLENTNNTSLAGFNKKDYAVSANSLANTAVFSTVTPVIFDKGRQLVQARASQTSSFNGTVVLNDDFPQYLKTISLNESISALGQAAAVPNRDQLDRTALSGLRSRKISAPEAYAIEQRTRTALSNQLKDIETIKTKAQEIDAQISAHQSFVYLKNTIAAIDALYAGIHTEEMQSAQRYYNIAQAELEFQLAERKKEYENAKNLFDGQRRTTADGVTIVSKYPTEALQVLEPMLAATQEDITRGGLLLTQLRNEPAGTASNTEIRNLTARYQASVNEFTALQGQAQTMAASARSQSAQANALRLEGERLYTEARNAFQRQDYDNSRERLERATARIDESLLIQESMELREYRNSMSLDLGQRIAMAQNETIINQVRSLVNTARDQYFAGNFQQAEDNLLRARNRWRIVSTEENEEVVYWLSMIQRAMSASSARVIPATAPLYPEISQLLSQARQNYEEGMRLINAGQRTQGLAKFDEARVQTREVKLMFPVNQEAGILELRMEQFTNPAAFNADFERRLNTAIAGTKRRSIESYADLLNLAEINPRYPGIRGIITQAEIDMGIRPPPPNPADVARSRELTASATRILEQRLTEQIPIALAQINEAITLDPNNQNAPRIKDRLLNMSNTTETSTVVLSSEDEERYRLAVRELQAGNNLVAYAHVERILQNPRNRNVAKVIELQRRIQAAL